MAMVDRGRRAGARSTLEGVLPPLRRRALRQVPQRDTRMDHASREAPRAGGPVDVAGARSRPTLSSVLLEARSVVADRRLPWEAPLPPRKLTPTRVLRGFATLLARIGTPARAPKLRGRSPGRPKGSLSGCAK